MYITKINEFLETKENKNTYYNKDIVVNDVDGNQMLVCRAYCTIVANCSISYNITIDDLDLFNQYRDDITEQLKIYKVEVETLATENNVPVI